MRWAALGVDYEMAGKDLIDLVRLAGHICRILGAQQPEGFIYELFLDEKGEKISKSRGNGLTIEEWLTYASPESLGALHVSEPAQGEAALFRRDPARRRRICRASRRLSERGAGREAHEPGVAHPFRRAAEGRASHQLRAAAQSRLGLELRGQGGAVGLHPPLCARRHAAGSSAARSARRLRHPLLP